MSFDSKPYSNGQWEVTVDGWRFYHDPMTVDQTSGRELRKYLTGYPGGPDWSYALPEPFVAAYENRMKDERLWCEARHALDTKGWAAARAILEPCYGWPTREVSHLPWEDHRRTHNVSFGGVRVDGCRWCAKDAEWDRRRETP